MVESLLTGAGLIKRWHQRRPRGRWPALTWAGGDLEVSQHHWPLPPGSTLRGNSTPARGCLCFAGWQCSLWEGEGETSGLTHVGSVGCYRLSRGGLGAGWVRAGGRHYASSSVYNPQGNHEGRCGARLLVTPTSSPSSPLVLRTPVCHWMEGPLDNPGWFHVRSST